MEDVNIMFNLEMGEIGDIIDALNSKGVRHASAPETIVFGHYGGMPCET
jgi:hypothetical protein